MANQNNSTYQVFIIPKDLTYEITNPQIRLSDVIDTNERYTVCEYKIESVRSRDRKGAPVTSALVRARMFLTLEGLGHESFQHFYYCQGQNTPFDFTVLYCSKLYNEEYHFSNMPMLMVGYVVGIEEVFVKNQDGSDSLKVNLELLLTDYQAIDTNNVY